MVRRDRTAVRLGHLAQPPRLGSAGTETAPHVSHHSLSPQGMPSRAWQTNRAMPSCLQQKSEVESGCQIAVW